MNKMHGINTNFSHLLDVDKLVSKYMDSMSCVTSTMKIENEIRKMAMPDFLVDPISRYKLESDRVSELARKAREAAFPSYIKIPNELESHTIKSIRNIDFMKSQSMYLSDHIKNSMKVFKDMEDKFRIFNFNSYQSEISKAIESIHPIKDLENYRSNLSTGYIDDRLKTLLEITGIEDKLFNKVGILGLNKYFLDAIEKAIKPQRLMFPNYVAEAIEILEKINSIYVIDENGNLLIDEEDIAERISSDALEFINKAVNIMIDPKSWILEQSLSVRIIIAVFILCMTLSSFFTNAIKFKELLSEDQNLKARDIIRETIKEEKQIYSLDELRGYRFVATQILHIRESCNIKSEIIGNLYIGDKVKIIQKSKDWSFIEYEDYDTLEQKQGWVFSRYLRRFVK